MLPPVSPLASSGARFRLREVALAPPVGRRAFLAHGEARLPGLALREGDVLCVGEGGASGWPAVFEPVVTAGHPMLGHLVQQQLRSLPADMPCSTRHWAAVGPVLAVWRGLGGSDEPAPQGQVAAPSPAPAAVPSPVRAVCVRLPAPGVALARAEHPEWLGRPVRVAGDGALVATGLAGATAAAPVASAALRGLAEQVAAELGAGAEVERADATEVRVTAAIAVDLRAVSRLGQRLRRRLRVPVCVAVADEVEVARRLSLALGTDELLFALPPARVPSVAHPAPAAPASRAGAPAPVLVAPEPPRTAALRPGGRPRAASAQLSLFDRLQAA